ncbi:hypothetical protein XBO1_1690019 [Xenorhabdus bovienii str. oregonense]|uniref:Uncharacterized protein n=1 Tax=Xenorhabdus bovienii str. oregonense TaxID=1398202 RepID=A0A077P5C9_XENBV|nr:hypothetical protein XBO1_1690019 [Xenorhabdus bovienii str. oregonense]
MDVVLYGRLVHNQTAFATLLKKLANNTAQTLGFPVFLMGKFTHNGRPGLQLVMQLP